MDTGNGQQCWCDWTSAWPPECRELTLCTAFSLQHYYHENNTIHNRNTYSCRRWHIPNAKCMYVYLYTVYIWILTMDIYGLLPRLSLYWMIRTLIDRYVCVFMPIKYYRTKTGFIPHNCVNVPWYIVSMGAWPDIARNSLIGCGSSVDVILQVLFWRRA